jgi:diketogulonate reductase-like aldo/keto reductase
VRQRAKSAVTSWIELNGTHIDTANDYRTQVEVGEAVAASGLQRSELFITTKCPGPIGFLATLQCAEDNLQMLGQYGVKTGYLDLLLIHFPFIIKPECYGSPSTEECAVPYMDPGDKARLETWRALELLQRQRRVHAIGLSDYSAKQLAHTIDNARQPVAVHQVLKRPWNGTPPGPRPHRCSFALL